MENTDKDKIHVIEALRIPKIYLAYMIYGENDTNKYLDMTIPEELWDKYHAPSYVMDTRRVKPVNLIEKGIQKGIIFKTTRASIEKKRAEEETVPKV